MTGLPVSTYVLSTGLALILIGLWGLLMQKNIIRMIIGFSLVDTGIHMVMIAIGYVTGGTAPIIDSAVPIKDAATRVVDPVPSALVLTAIVIGLGVTAVMLSYAVNIYREKKSLSIDDCSESKW
ncbi:MAG: sodium:proton antiporter [Thiogranum sp.]|jgi:multicomponent Na+:H+ antiporter subunit C|nr:sodium:proton antiporter [Thiogranum sp.]